MKEPNLYPCVRLVRRIRYDTMPRLLLVEDGESDYGFQTYADEIRKKVLFIYFKFGGHVNLHLANVDVSRLKNFIDNLTSNTVGGTCTPELLEMQRQLQFLREIPELDADSAPSDFTQMWETELQVHLGTTNFVPLENGHELQNGKFLVTRGISFGGMSAVYLGTTNDGTAIVVKESSLPIRCEPASKTKTRELFEREALLLYTLQHPSIAKVLDYFVENGKDYLVLEYVKGTSLRQSIRQNGPMDETLVTSVGLQICSILEYLHGQSPQVLHRDLTPDNLILHGGNKVVLIDSGAANEYIGTATGTVTGKQNYIALEQLQGKAKAQSDIYSLGCTLYFLLTGADPEPLTQSHPTAVRDNVPIPLSDIVAAATDLDLDKRTVSAGALSTLLSQTSSSSCNPHVVKNTQDTHRMHTQ